MENDFVDEYGVSFELLDSILSKLLIIGPPDEDDNIIEDDFDNDF